MGFRIVTWNVNGIRNPFSYQPWRDKRSFEAMFDTLEADIVVFQEAKIQKKDLHDDMVLVPGWDCFFSLPKHKKGYSGVVIYTRNAKCCPIRAEEGITGVLCPPSSTVPFRDLPEENRIGGYLTEEQIVQWDIEEAVVDSEGRCVILEIPAFVLIGVYCPATRDETRDDFRLGFLNTLDCRVRNLAAMGKRVILTGDLNICRSQVDSAHALEQIRKGKLTSEEYISSPSRRILNHLVDGGNVVGDRDTGRENSILWDTSREFHQDRLGMYTCWEQRLNARPGNYGARIDYVLCSLEMAEWVSSADIQEGLMGSDHCPVYASFHDEVPLDSKPVNILDIMNPPDTFENGNRIQEYSSKKLLPTSGKLIPEFTRRRTIKDMFFRKPSDQSNKTPRDRDSSDSTPQNSAVNIEMTAKVAAESSETPTAKKRVETKSSRSQPTAKRAKRDSVPAPTPSAGQRSIKGFFTQKGPPKTSDSQQSFGSTSNPDFVAPSSPPTARQPTPQTPRKNTTTSPSKTPNTTTESQETNQPSISSPSSEPLKKEDGFVNDPIVSKESWSKLFRKRSPPKCDGHDEPCVSFVTKKPGLNCGRSFWVCSRPLGPSGNKEGGTQWRCPTFIWSSDWNGSMSSAADE